MNEREMIQDLLTSIQVSFNEEPHVYYQPPESLKMAYPCFRYNLVGSNSRYADDIPYLHTNTYNIMYITKEAEPAIPEFLKNLPKARFNRKYSANGLNHFVFTCTGMLMYVPSENIELDLTVLGGN